jgi:hypothetical protein
MSIYLIHSRWALGDTVCMTALARDFHAAYGRQHQLAVAGNYSPVWFHNPYVLALGKTGPAPSNAKRVSLEHQHAVHDANYGGPRIHFLRCFYDIFNKQTGLQVPILRPHGDLHLAGKETMPLYKGRYWVLAAGHKRDVTIKQWGYAAWQALVDRLRGAGLNLVQTGSTATRCYNPKLQGVTDAVGCTQNERDLFSLIAHADGVVCGVSAAMHIAAAFEKPCVVLAGGREAPWWEHYTDRYNGFGPQAKMRMEHKFLHTVGELACCRDSKQSPRGCWKHWVTPPTVLPRNKWHGKMCADVVQDHEHSELRPRCIAMITPEDAARAVLSYQTPVEPQDELVKLRQFALPRQAPLASAVAPVGHPVVPGPEDEAFRILDHPLLGGRVTVGVVCYGEHFALAERCIGGILRTVPPARLDLRVGLNAVEPATREYLSHLPQVRVYDHPSNDMKYPVMRQMLHDPHHPIATPYLVWFDDDSAPIDPLWLVKLAREIIDHHEHGCRLYGARFLHNLQMYAKHGHRPDRWFRSAPWWRGKDLLLGKSGRTGPNGSVIPFVAGGFWALHTPLLKEADIPDTRLYHNGGDITIGCQVYQAGGLIRHFDANKKIVLRSGAARRGYSEQFPWARPVS